MLTWGVGFFFVLSFSVSLGSCFFLCSLFPVGAFDTDWMVKIG